jgi:acetyl esterase/lipase
VNKERVVVSATIMFAFIILYTTACDRDRGQRMNLPGEDIRTRVHVVDTAAGGVSVVWLARERRDNGVIVYLHGGAYRAGPFPGEWAWLSALADRTQTAAVMVNYRLAPEHPFPAALDDAVAAIRSLSLPRDRWILAGASAGGGLALATVRALIDDHNTPPAALLLQAPLVDMTLENPRLPQADSADTALDAQSLRRALRDYSKQTPLSDPRLSPLFLSFEDFPPTRLEIGTRDLMWPDNQRLRDRLLAFGVRLDYIEERDAPHVFAHRLPLPEAGRALHTGARWIKQHVSGKNKEDAADP